MQHDPTSRSQTTEELFEQQSEKLFTYLRLHTQSREDAEDILVDTFMAALAEPKFAHLLAPMQVAWLWKVARNKVADTFRKTAIRRSQSLARTEETISEDEAHDPVRAALRQDQVREIQSLLHQLPPQQEEMLRLRFGNDLRCNEIATVLGKRETAVRTMLSRSMNLLRQLYAQRTSTSRPAQSDTPGTRGRRDEEGVLHDI